MQIKDQFSELKSIQKL